MQDLRINLSRLWVALMPAPPRQPLHPVSDRQRISAAHHTGSTRNVPGSLRGHVGPERHGRSVPESGSPSPCGALFLSRRPPDTRTAHTSYGRTLMRLTSLRQPGQFLRRSVRTIVTLAPMKELERRGDCSGHSAGDPFRGSITISESAGAGTPTIRFAADPAAIPRTDRSAAARSSRVCAHRGSLCGSRSCCTIG